MNLTDPLVHLQAALADRYAIAREIGRGGMATVYLPEDLKHQRTEPMTEIRVVLRWAQEWQETQRR